MTITLQDPATEQPSTAPAQRLRWTTVAVRVSLRWLGVRKTLTPEQKTEAALSFGAEGEFLSARKKLLDTRHPAYQEVTAVRGKVLAYWKAMTLPYPEPGIRLLRHTEVEAFHQKLGELRTELHEAVARLDEHYAELQQTARLRAALSWQLWKRRRDGFQQCGTGRDGRRGALLAAGVAGATSRGCRQRRQSGDQPSICPACSIHRLPPRG